MEAKALHDFVQTAPDELSFNKGSILKVINIDDDANWFKAEQDGRTGFVPANYLDMAPHIWFHGKISRVQAEQILLKTSYDGAFLFRESESQPGGFSLSVRVSNGQGVQVQHFKILRDDVGKYFLWSTKFNSLNELITYHKTSTVSRSEEIYLLTAIGRNGQAAGSAGATAAPISAAPQQSRPAQARPAAPAGGKTVTAMFDFSPQEPGEIAFRKGDIITVINQDNADWWQGQCNGQTGMFPSTYVK